MDQLLSESKLFIIIESSLLNCFICNLYIQCGMQYAEQNQINYPIEDCMLMTAVIDTINLRSSPIQILCQVKDGSDLIDIASAFEIRSVGMKRVRKFSDLTCLCTLQDSTEDRDESNINSKKLPRSVSRHDVVIIANECTSIIKPAFKKYCLINAAGIDSSNQAFAVLVNEELQNQFKQISLSNYCAKI